MTSPAPSLKAVKANPSPIARAIALVDARVGSSQSSRDYLITEVTRLRKLAREYAEEGRPERQYEINFRADKLNRQVADWDIVIAARLDELTAVLELAATSV